MKRLLSIAVAAFLVSASVSAQTPPLGEAAKGMLGTWEFTNAARDKSCTVTFKSARVASGLALAFDSQCAALFPLLRGVAAWKFPQNDLLYMLDAKGGTLIEFSEAEDGIYEAPTPGLGVVFLQPPGTPAGDYRTEPDPVQQQ